MKRYALTAITLVVFLCLALMLSGCRGAHPQAVSSGKPSTVQSASAVSTPNAPQPLATQRKAPAFTVTDIDGMTHSLSDYRGKILVVDFWATYCKPCVKKLRETESLFQNYRSAGVAFLALSMDETDAVIKGWREENEVSFPLARQDDNIKTLFFGNAALVPIPQVRIIDRHGMIRYSLGPEGTTEQVEAAIKALLAERR